ncbi:MAG: hypothetical protein KatS3mg102_0302 [Planctomycetota bacterium]|nr:MAG: hypothetical protein KatS3mg102_0302 [Planctomycetota bacterium]
MVATHLAAPFFSLYMLRDLGFNYVAFTAAATAMVLAQVLVLRSWGRLADRFGSRRILAVCGLVVSLTPWLWLISPRLEAVLCYQVVSGVGWAGFNLAAANFLFDSVSPPKRARCVAYSSILTHAGVLAGALLGGVLAPLVPQRIALGGWELELRSPLLVLFALSGALRLAVSLYYLPRIREVRPGVEPSTHWQVIYHVTGLAAIRGLRFSIFTGNGGPARTQNHHSA